MSNVIDLHQTRAAREYAEQRLRMAEYGVLLEPVKDLTPDQCDRIVERLGLYDDGPEA